MNVKKIVTDNLSKKDKLKIGVTAMVHGKEAAKEKAIRTVVPKIASKSLPLLGVEAVLSLVYFIFESKTKKLIILMK